VRVHGGHRGRPVASVGGPNDDKVFTGGLPIPRHTHLAKMWDCIGVVFHRRGNSVPARDGGTVVEGGLG
jgi:hypothetical protein